MAETFDSQSKFVHELISQSQAELDRVALAQQEALINSLGCSPEDFPTTIDNIYGDPFGLVRQYYQDRAISDIVSPFSAEQTSALTTAIAGPWISQRDVLYVEPNSGDEDSSNRARIRERLWEKCIRSPYTNWSLVVWQAVREMIVKSRGYIEVCHLTQEEKRKRYSYNPIKVAINTILSGFMRLLGQAGTTRLSRMEMVTLWDGPVMRCRPFGTVFRDPTESVLSESSKWVAYKDQWTRADIEVEGARTFPKGSKIPFDPEVLDRLQSSHTDTQEVRTRETNEVRKTTAPATAYEPYDVIVWKGVDPEEEEGTRWIYWIINGTCVGAKEHDGSGSWNNIVELAWDPMVDFATSVSPIMLIRRIQEMDSMLLSNGLDASTWESHPSGLVNELVVNDIEVVRNMRPAQFEKKMGEGNAIERIQLAGSSMQTFQHAATIRELGRAATAGTAQVAGISPPGVTTATEFSGLSAGALGRVQLQQEINAEVAFKRLFYLQHADWRDSILDDATLIDLVGDDGTLGEVTLEALDEDMDCTPLASRYNVIRQKELGSLRSLLADARLDPYLMAKLKKEECYDDLVYLTAGGPRGWRWAKTAKQMGAEGNTPAALEQMQIQNAATSGGMGGGQPSQAKLPSAQPSEVIPPTEGGAG